MSKSRTGRKGRVRLAVAAGLGDMDTANADAAANAIVDADGRLGAASGFRAADDDKSDAAILDYIQKQLHKPGTANALFQQGEVRGPLIDAVDTQNGASGLFASITAGNLDAAAGEATAAAIAPLSNSGGQFAHYVFGDGGEHAVAAGAVTNATANAPTATEAYGIAYHNGGPGADFSGLRDLGTLDQGLIAASSIIINPTMDTIWGDSNVTSPAKLRLEFLGVTSDANNVAGGGEEILIESTGRTQATCKVEFNGRDVGGAGASANGVGGAGSGGFPVGGEIVIRDASGVLLTIVGSNTGENDLVAGDADTDNVEGKNFHVDSATKIFVIAHDSVGGATAYPDGNGQKDTMGGFVNNLVAAITAWGATYGAKISASQGAGTGALPHARANLTLTLRNARGTAGTNGVSVGTNDPGSLLTVTAYSSEGQVVVPLAGNGHDWMVTPASATGITHSRFGADAGTAGDNGTDYDTTTRVATAQLGDGSVLNLDIEDLPVKVSYVTAAAKRAGISDGVPDVQTAGFGVIWGLV